MSYYGSLGRRRAVATSGLVTLEALYYYHVAFDPDNAAVSVNYANTGICTGTNGTDPPLSYIWLLAGAAADYEIKVDLVAGSADTPSGTLGTWVSLATSRSYGLSRTTIGGRSCELDVSIRRASDGLVLMENIRQTLQCDKEI